MGQRMIHTCDACGTENVEADRPVGGPAMYVGLNENWGHLHVGMGVSNLMPGGVPVSFDLCEQCIAKAVAALGLKIPSEQEIAAQYVGMGMVAGHVMRRGGPQIRRRPSHLKPVGGALTKEDLEQLGLKPDEADGDVAPAPDVDFVTGTFTCPKCGTQRPLTYPNPVCLSCGYHDPDPRYR